jgi:hypothetical protein
MMNKVILNMIAGGSARHRVGPAVIVVREGRQRFVGMRIGVVLVMVMVMRVVV